MKLTDLVSRLKGLVKKSPAKTRAKTAKAANVATKKTDAKRAEAKRADVKRARQAARTSRKRG